MHSSAKLWSAMAVATLLSAAHPALAAIHISGDVQPDPLVDDAEVVVGDTQYGLVEIDGGNTLRSTKLSVGDTQPAAHGRVRVTGPGSAWTVTGRVEMASHGLGYLEIADGGVLSTDEFYGGYSPSGYAEVVVTGEGSRLELTGQMDIGQAALADVRISDGALLNAPQGYIRFGEGVRASLDDAMLRVNHLDLAGRLTGNGIITALSGPVVNGGTIEVDPLDSLTLAARVTNTGIIEVDHGELELFGIDNQDRGYITLEDSVLRGSPGDRRPYAFENEAHIAAIGGTSDLYGLVVNNNLGTLSVVNDSLLRIHGDVLNQNGTIAISSGSKALVLGNFAFYGGTLHADLEGDGESPFGELEVVGDVMLEGNMRLEAASLAAFSAGDQFPLVSATGEISGQLDLAEMPPLSGGLTWKVTQTAGSVVLGVGLPGDFNADNRVNLADYVVWRNTLGSHGSFQPADEWGPSGRPDGFVDHWDYDFWKSNFGLSATSIAATAAVPEPSALVCGILAALLWCVTTRQHTQNLF